jgi:hypothetical protein
MTQSKDGALGNRMVVGGVLTTALGAIFSLIGLTQGYWSSLVGLVLSSVIGYLLASVGAHKSGRSVWDAIKELTLATERVAEEWTPPKIVPIQEFVPPSAVVIFLRYQLDAKKLNTPMKIRVSTQPDGYGLSAEGSGESGELKLMLESVEHIYCSVSHPSIKWTIRCLGYEDNF